VKGNKMIEIKNLTKKFGKLYALNNLNMIIEEGGIFGIVGSNGAGKSTLMRLIVGVYQSDHGDVFVDSKKAYENPKAKSQCVFLSDTAYFSVGASLESMAVEYAKHYKTFSIDDYESLVNNFGLNPKVSLSTFSKGMQKQAMIILALACNCKYTLLDETLDGLDPVMRGVVKKRIYQSVIDRNATVVITSHSLRELDDMCDNLAMLHKGKIIYQKDVQDIKTSLIKVQIAFDDDFDIKRFNDIEVIKYTKNGSVANLIVKGDKEKTALVLKSKKPMLLEIVPLSLEEIFTYELKERGYAFEDVVSKEENEDGK
jgi:ABC-2 type transport system ATP-binding protein